MQPEGASRPIGTVLEALVPASDHLKPPGLFTQSANVASAKVLNLVMSYHFYMKQKRMPALFMVALLFMPLLFGIALANPDTNPDKPRPVVPFDELPDDIKIILEERASPRALELIKIGRPPSPEMVNAGIGREKFVGDIFPVYHEHGAVYIFRGDGTAIFGGNVSSVSGLKPDEISIMEVWSTEELERLFGERSPPPEPDSPICPSSSASTGAEYVPPPYPSPEQPPQMPAFGAIAGIVGLLLLTAWVWLTRRK